MTKKTTPVKAAAAKAAPTAAVALSAASVLLDGRSHPIHPLKVGALKRAMIGVSDMEGADQTAENASRLLGLMAETVAMATGKTAEEIDNLANQAELQAAFGRVLSFSGAKEPTPGEAARQGR